MIKHALSVTRQADFAAWYDILRNEAPLTFSCEYAGPAFDPATPSRTISWFQLFTGQQEPPGEGPDGASTALRLQALEGLRGRLAGGEDRGRGLDEVRGRVGPGLCSRLLTVPGRPRSRGHWGSRGRR